ncbi:MAG TPA: sulfite exporter TauE/SafE family protein, partial [Saprospiraceae bacterium]|nr:sulfite exporter TauE/SafE family protein [Saprospiraceae bacterium]
RANAIKGLVIAIFTLALIVVFQYTGRIDWRVGLVIASGQALGGFLTARYASRYAQARIWAYRLLIIVVLASILKIFLF